jgi:uncharacterized membrane protein YidH (DUF202 family)
MNVNALEAIAYLVIAVGLLVIIAVKLNRYRKNRRMHRGVANYLRQLRR